jgi:hypothetical protein
MHPERQLTGPVVVIVVVVVVVVVVEESLNMLPARIETCQINIKIL